ncbi:hypothetical protein EVG20_g1174 [Dentipellis fragilis]|uniref:Uncharacterized protein n=1 Tax=Dentipellis fragilis TaxID=205917 RepID=A0A4Y9ZCW4_9AGAM|nr:hypothetical protein EVG20_g1174 [Dentipellis fragilis]
MPKKSIFRQPGVQHFQLVHRSQRDPLIHDPEASQHVLKPFIRENDKKGKSRAELEKILSPSDLAHDTQRPNVGEASLYGIYYDDTDYDYMQHLRPVGDQEEGVDSVLVEAPTQKKSKGKGKEGLTLRDLPPEALPSTSELPRNYENQEAIPSSIAGFQPDMDPHLRQVLEALEDDAFMEEDADDDFFGELVGGGEREKDEGVYFEFAEEGVGEEEEAGEEGEGDDELPEDAGWEARFAAFKKAQKDQDGATDVDGYSEGGDTVGRMPEFSVIGGKKRRKGTSDASGYSMSSSSMFRNEGLRMVDERFDQIEKEYASDEEEIEDVEDDDDTEPQLITTREDFDSMMDDFLDNYEIFGGKMKPALHGTGAEKLETLRTAMGQDQRVKEKDSDESSDNDDADIYAYLEKEDKRDRWDVETVLTAHTNLENHPRLIRARESKPVPQIRLDPKTGLPIVLNGEELKPRRKPVKQPTLEEEEIEGPVHVTVARPRNESKEEKKVRKQAVKAERQTRRVEKKATKEQFSAAIKQQTQVMASKDVKTRKL